MTRPYLTRSETRRGDQEPGVRVVIDGRLPYLFPGERNMALALARFALGDELDKPSTLIEVGYTINSSWCSESVFKSPARIS